MPNQTHIHFHQANQEGNLGVKKNPNLLTISSIKGNAVIINSFSNTLTISSMWIATGTNSNSNVTVATSLDGLTWMTANNTTVGRMNAVAFSGNSFVGVGQNSRSNFNISVSSDGDTWNTVNYNALGYYDGYGVAYGNGVWVATVDRGVSSSDRSSIIISTDGSNWQIVNSPLSGGRGVAYGQDNSTWVAVGYSNNRSSIAVSIDNGTSWLPSSNSQLQYGYGVAYGNSTWVAVGQTFSKTSTFVCKSSDGSVWSVPLSSNVLSRGNAVAYGTSNRWIAVGLSNSASTIAYSTNNGDSWTCSRNDPFVGGYGTGIAHSIVNRSSIWVAVGSNVNNLSSIAISRDNGLTWRSASNDPFMGGKATSVAYVSSYVLPVYSNNGISFGDNLSLEFVDNKLTLVSGDKYLVFRDSVIDYLNTL